MSQGETILLPGTGIETTRLGFGTALLMGTVDWDASLSLLETAYDSGIRHFDTARLYGYGGAEQALGAFMKGRRDRVTVATKLGLNPPAVPGGLLRAKAVARRVVERWAPGLRARLGRGTRGMVERSFTPESARAAFERSLAALDTGHVDILFLHDCQPADLEDAALTDYLLGLKEAGRVRALGVATDPAAAASLRRSHPEIAQVVQIADSDDDPAIAALVGHPGAPPATITHSILAERMRLVAGHLRRTDGEAAWARRLGCASLDGVTLAGLLIDRAMRRNPGGVVLFSTTDRQRIGANLDAMRGLSPSSERDDALDRLLAEAAGGAEPPAAMPASVRAGGVAG